MSLSRISIFVNIRKADSEDDDDSSNFLNTCVRKRRKMIHNAALLTALWIAYPTLGPQGQNRTEESHFSWPDHVGRLSRAEFKARYRLCPESFDELVNKIRDQTGVSDEAQAMRSRGDIPPHIILFFLLM